MKSKEKIFWKRNWEMRRRFPDLISKIILFPIIFIIIALFHCAFAFMHFAFVGYLYIFNRKQYDKNIEKERLITT
jgi:predicted membrane protein